MKKTIGAIFLFLFLMPPHIASAAPFLYITNHDSNSVSVIDASTNSVTATIPVGNGPSGIAVDVLGRRAYAANSNDGTISVIDTATNSVMATIETGLMPVGLALGPNGERLYVSDYEGGLVFVADTSSLDILSIISVGDGPQGIVASPDGGRAYVANTNENTVSVIDTSRDAVIGIVTVGKNPIGLDVTADGSLVVVENTTDNTVSFISTDTNTVTETVVVGTYPQGVAASPNSARAYVTNYSDNSVSVIDTAASTTVATIPVGTNPRGIAVDSSGGRIYVVNRNSNNVSVIETATNNVIATISVGTAPLAFGKFIGASLMPVPGGPFALAPSDPLSSPFLSANATFARPFAVGNIAGGSLNLQVGTVPFGGPVDLRLAIYAPSVDPANIYMIGQDGSLQPLSAGFPAWRSGVTGSINESIYGTFPANLLPYGTYSLYTIVTPAGSLDAYYLWSTSFAVPEPIQGEIITENFTIAAGETRLATGDLVVRASKSIEINGTLLVNEGADISLLSEGPVTISGNIRPNVTESPVKTNSSAILSQNIKYTHADSGDSSIAICSPKVTITADGDMSLSSSLLIATVGAGIVEIYGNVRTRDGADGTIEHYHGEDGGDIDIGTDSALDLIRNQRGVPTAAMPASVKIPASLRTGSGGRGYNDHAGHRDGETQYYIAGLGGLGGKIRISSVALIDLTNGRLFAGHGGDGGSVWFQRDADYSHLDGKEIGEQGLNVIATSGGGGIGGSVILTTPNIISSPSINPGSGGSIGNIRVRAGNGGAGGRGGNTIFNIGTLGFNGAITPTLDNFFVLRTVNATVYLMKGGNGGASISPGMPGGAGGNVQNNVSGAIRFLAVNNYSNGGNGYNGCQSTPVTSGTSGGNGGTIDVQTSVAELDPVILNTVARGGDGGNGNPPGIGGEAGKFDDKSGLSGVAGGPCPGTSTSFWGSYGTQFIVISDPAGHKNYIGLPGSATLTINGPFLGDIIKSLKAGADTMSISVTGPSPFVNVSGTLTGNSFTAQGTGTVAGYPNVSVKMIGSFDEMGGSSGTYEMGANGELPGGQSIIYSFSGSKQ